MDVSFEAAAIDPLLAIAPARAPTAPADGAPSFDDHLAAQTDPERPEAQSAKPTDDAPPADTPATPVVAAAPPPTPTMAPALTVQLAAAEPAAAPQAEATPAHAGPIDISAPASEIAAAPAQPQAAVARAQDGAPTPAQHASHAAAQQAAPAQQTETPAEAAAPSNDAPVQAAKPSEPAPAAADPNTSATAQPQQAQQQAAASPELAAQLATIAVTPVALSTTQTKDTPSAPQAKAIDGAKAPADKTLPADGADIAAAPQPKADTPQAPAPNAAQARADAPSQKSAETTQPVQAAQQSTPAPAQVEQRHAIAETAPTDAARTAPVAHQVTREIVRRFNGGATQFELRLDPAELGRVDVRLEVGRDNKVTAMVSAETPQAVSELARGARDIAQALQSAGLELAENGLSFDLSQRQAQHEAALDSRSGAGGVGKAEEDSAPAPIVMARPFGLESWRGVRVDVMA